MVLFIGHSVNFFEAVAFSSLTIGEDISGKNTARANEGKRTYVALLHIKSGGYVFKLEIYFRSSKLFLWAVEVSLIV